MKKKLARLSLVGVRSKKSTGLSSIVDQIYIFSTASVRVLNVFVKWMIILISNRPTQFY